MAWPVSQDYNEAIQAPQSSFSDPELKGGEPVTNALGMPMPRSGNFADVYEFNTPATKSKWAIKCFTRHVPGLRERYTEISAGLVAAKLPFAVEFQYLVQGIRVRGDWFPILKMRWVEGFLLNEFVRDNLDKPALLGNLGLIWCRMAKRLRDANIAHADLQHGNVILVPGSKASSLAVKLIDYDGMFVPALANKKSGEVGHPNYQHPQRLREGTYSAEVDRFPLLVVATALKALSVGGRELWDRHDNGDNLLFREADLKAPEKSALFKELGEMKDAQTRTLVESLKAAVEKKLEEAPLVDELLPETKPTQVRPTASPTAIAAVEPEATVEPEALSDFAGIESPAAAPKKRPQPSRWPLWGVLGGAAAVVSLCLLLAGAGVLWAVFGGSKPNDPIAQNKSDGDGPKLAVNKDSDKKLLKDGDNKPSKDGLTKDPEKDRTGGKIEQPITVPPKNGNGAVAEKPWTPTDGFVPLITPDLAAWRANANWRVENGIVTATDAAGMLLETVRDNYKDFHLRFDTRVKKFGSIDFRSPAASANPTFYSLHMAAGPGNVRLTRTVATGPKTSTSEPFGPSADLPVGEWVSVQLVAQGNRFKVLLNGALVIDAVDEKKTSRGRSILLIGSKDACEYRKMDIRELSPTVPDVPIAADKGFVPLFNGMDLAGWKAPAGPGKGNWRVENGILVGDDKGIGFLYTDKPQPRDFHLRCEARLSSKKGSASLLFRSQENMPLGYCANLVLLGKGEISLGDLQYQAPGKTEQLRVRSLKRLPSDTWALVEIIASGKRLIMKVDNEVTTDVEDGKKLTAGHVLLMQHPQTRVEFRKIEIKPLSVSPPDVPAMAPDSFTPLFNGRDLAGWGSYGNQNEDWQVIDGVLTGKGPNLKMLATTRDDFTDLHLRIEARINAAGFSSVAFRYPHGPADLAKQALGGYAVRLTGKPDVVSKTGNLIAFEKVGRREIPANLLLAGAGEWFQLDIIAQADTLTTMINGKEVVGFKNPKTDIKKGRIVLEAMSTAHQTLVEFRKIEIKELKATTPERAANRALRRMCRHTCCCPGGGRTK